MTTTRTRHNRNTHVEPETVEPETSEPETSEPSAAPLVDYNTLTVETIEKSEFRQPRKIRDVGPFAGWMQESLDSKLPKRVTVPTTAGKQTQDMIRAAAIRVGCGVRIAAVPQDGDNVRIDFLAGTRKAHTDHGSGICTLCHKTIKLTRDGTLRKHNVEGTECAGTGSASFKLVEAASQS